MTTENVRSSTARVKKIVCVVGKRILNIIQKSISLQPLHYTAYGKKNYDRLLINYCILILGIFQLEISPYLLNIEQ